MGSVAVAPGKLQAPVRFYQAPVGKKVVVAVTGVILFGFVIAHLLGNLQVFLGPEKMNAYARFLHENVELLWGARIVLLISVLLHIVATAQLAVLKSKARPIGYVRKVNAASSYASRTMIWSGPIILAFVVYHLLHFTFGTVHPNFQETNGIPLAYQNLVTGFQKPACLPGIRCRDDPAGHTSLSRRLEHVPVARYQPSAVHAAAQAVCRSNVHRLDARIYFHSRGRAGRNGTPSMNLDSRIPSGPIEKKWDQCKFDMKLVNPANKRKYRVIVVGTGLAGGSAAATLAELGYNVECFCFQDSPRRAHSIAAQGGINAAKNYQNDGDSIYRLFYDTVKGGDYRAREANVYRLAQISVNIIDQCVAQGVPFAREYGGLLANRSFGGAQVSRTFYARGTNGPAVVTGRLSGPGAADRGGQSEHACAP